MPLRSAWSFIYHGDNTGDYWLKCIRSPSRDAVPQDPDNRSEEKFRRLHSPENSCPSELFVNFLVRGWDRRYHRSKWRLGYKQRAHERYERQLRRLRARDLVEDLLELSTRI